MRRLLLLALLAFAALAAPASAADCTITFAPASGAWSAPASWDLGRVPAAGDTACIPAGRVATHANGTSTVAAIDVDGLLRITGGTLALAGDSTAASLELAGGTLAGAGTLTVEGTLTWTEGEMDGAGTTRIAPTGRLLVDGSTAAEDGRLIEVAGVLEMQGDHHMFGQGTPLPLLHVLPGGTVRKTAGADTASLAPRLLNDGAVESTSGELELWNAATGAHGGVFRGAGADARVSFAGGFTLDPHVLGPAARLEGWVEIGGGVVEIPDGVTIAVPDHLLMTDGDLRGAGRLDVAGELVWSGGRQLGPGTTAIRDGGLLRIASDGGSCGVTLEDGRRVLNEGTLRLDGGMSLSGYGDVLDNRGRLELDDTATGFCGDWRGILGEIDLRNTGTIEKVGGTGRARVDARLDNEGIVRAASGELELGGATADEPQGGAFTSAPGARLVLGYGDFVLAPSATMTGDLAVEDARLEVPQGTTLAVPAGGTLRMEGGTLAGAGDLSVSGRLDWRRGDQEGPGTTVVEPGGVAVVGGDGGFADLRESRVLVNRGTVRIADGELFAGAGATIANEALLELRTDGRLSGSGFGFGAGSLLHNTGTLRKLGATAAEAELPVENEGTVDVVAGRLELPRLLNWSSLFLSTGSLTGGAYVVRDGGALVLPGQLETVAAQVTLDGPGSRLLRRTFTAPEPVDALEGVRRITAAGDLRLGGGRSHTLTGPLHNAGSLRLGARSTLSAASYRQTGVLRTTVDGSSAGRVATPGAATLGGRLDVATTRTGSAPVSVVAAGSRTGTFAAVTGAAGRWAVGYTGTGVTLTPLAPEAALRAAAAPAPALVEPTVEEPPLVVKARDLRAVRGSWRRRGAFVVARRRGATLVRRGVAGRALALRVRTCRRCGSVTVRWGRRSARVSLRSARRGRRVLAIPGLDGRRRGAVRLRASSRRVAIAALVVLR